MIAAPMSDVASTADIEYTKSSAAETGTRSLETLRLASLATVFVLDQPILLLVESFELG
jgi:hypothetical protein